MKFAMTVALLCVLWGTAQGQSALPDVASARSVSGQFMVLTARSTFPEEQPPPFAANTNFVSFDPALLAVSCERIKQALCRELGVSGAWRGTVRIVLHPARNPDELVTIVSQWFKDGWNYRVELPDTVERARYMRTMVNVLLLELANRNAGDRSAEIPLWLTEGLTQILLTLPATDLTPPRPRFGPSGPAFMPTIVDSRPVDSLKVLRETLCKRPLLTIADLSWPTDETFTGEAGEVYRANAQLFVSELLRLNDGRPCIQAMLDGLSQCYNWQTAFFRAFQSHFERQLDLEKWWALQAAHFIGRDPAQAWSPQESWDKLDAILQTSVVIHRSAVELPERAQVPLATIISEWDHDRQTPVLQDKLRELEQARLRMPQELARLADEYRQLIAGYLEMREKIGFVLPTARPTTPTLKGLLRDTLKQLDALESKRRALQPQPTAPIALTNPPVALPAP